MFSFLKRLFGGGPKIDLRALVLDGAQIIDVRSPGEYQSGHIKGSINLPLPNLQNSLGKLKKDKPVITCCASGMRSGMAKSLLQSKGFTEVYNGGGWASLQSKIS